MKLVNKSLTFTVNIYQTGITGAILLLSQHQKRKKKWERGKISTEFILNLAKKSGNEVVLNIRSEIQARGKVLVYAIKSL